jgi:hypothetical protein
VIKAVAGGCRLALLAAIASGCGALLVMVASTVVLQAQVDACTVLSLDEIKSALGRKELAVAKAGRASGGYSDCRFAGSGNGDIRITLSPPLSGAKSDFDLKPQIYSDEGKKFEKVTGIGDGAYYWDDTIEFRVGNRIVSLWVNRTPRTEPPAAVKGALAGLARHVVDRLRGVH